MIAYLRMKAGPWALGEPLGNNSILKYPTELYTIKGFTANNVDEEKVLYINTDKFFTVDGFDYIQGVISEHFNIQMPEICRELHTLYINEKVRIYGSMMP
jgi:hypothetical protein